MQYIFAVWGIGLLGLCIKAEHLRKTLIGYLRSYYPDVPRWISWVPWPVFDRAIRQYCKEYDVEDAQLTELLEEFGRAFVHVCAWALSLPALFCLLIGLTYLFSP